MSRLRVGSWLRYDVAQRSSFIFCVSAATTAHQSVSTESFTLRPALDYQSARVGLGGNRIVRFEADPGSLEVEYRAEVLVRPELRATHALVEPAHAELPSEVIPYLNPSRYCPSDRLTRWADQEFGHLQRGHDRVTAICRWIFDHVAYIGGTTDASSDACDVLIQRSGVCRDFAHVAISICRALCIPARYVSGYAVGLEPPDFHGYFEVFLGSHWYLFDATQRAPRGGFVRIGTGLDAADCAFAVIVGAAMLESMRVDAEVVGDGESPGDARGAAISTA